MVARKIAAKLASTQKQLKGAGCRVSLWVRSGRLSLRAILPDRDHPGTYRQQGIPLGVPCDESGIEFARRKALTLDLELAEGRFDWANWDKKGGRKGESQAQSLAQPITVPGRHDIETLMTQWRAAFDQGAVRESKEAADSTRKKKTRENTWATKYRPLERRLRERSGARGSLSGEQIYELALGLIQEKQANGKTAIAKILATSAISLNRLGLGWSQEQERAIRAAGAGYQGPSARAIPGDDQILAFSEHLWQRQLDAPKKLKQARLRLCYAFRLQAAYGLRCHEIYELRASDLERMTPQSPVLIVPDGKTGPREVWPFHPGWFELWRLSDPAFYGGLPTSNAVVRRERGSRYTIALAKAGSADFGIKGSHCIRHAWSLRTLTYNLPPEMAAQQMGHTIEVHLKTYKRWIDRKRQQQFFEAIKRET